MSEITVNVDDYITEEEKRDIAKSAFHAVCVQKAKDDFERILSNAGYDLVEREVNEAFDGNMRETVKKKAIEVINSLSHLSVFRPKNAWDKEETKGWAYLQSALDENRELIHDKVVEIIQGISSESIREILEERLLDALVDRIKGQK